MALQTFPCSESRWGRCANGLCRNRLNLIYTDTGNETDWMRTHKDAAIETPVCETESLRQSASLKANAEIVDVAVGGGQTNFEHSLQ